MLVSSLYNIDKRTKAIEKELSMRNLLGIKNERITKLRISNDLGSEFQWLDGAIIECSLYYRKFYWCQIFVDDIHADRILVPLNTDIWVNKIDVNEVYIQKPVNKHDLRNAIIVATRSNKNRIGKLYIYNYIIHTPYVDIDEYFVESAGTVRRILCDWKRYSNRVIHLDKNLIPLDYSVPLQFEIKSPRVAEKLLSYKIVPTNLSFKITLNSVLLFKEGQLCLNDAGRIFEIDNEIQHVYDVQVKKMIKYLKKEYNISLHIGENQ